MRYPPIDARIKVFVREVYRKRLATQKQLAKLLGISQSSIHRIVSYEDRWHMGINIGLWGRARK